MPIIDMLTEQEAKYPEGAFSPVGPGSWNADTKPDHRIVLVETHKGLCLYERERNMYDDSDFFMIVWDPEAHCTKEIMFASTRFWSYPCMASHPDATPEVKVEFTAWRIEQDRRNDILRRWGDRRRRINMANDLGITRSDLKRLMTIYHRQSLETKRNPDDFDLIVTLLKTKNFRSNFRKSLADQIRKWLKTPDSSYGKPLSQKQMASLQGF